MSKMLLAFSFHIQGDFFLLNKYFSIRHFSENSRALDCDCHFHHLVSGIVRE